MKTTVTPLLVGGRMRQITVPAVVTRAPCGKRASAATVRGRYGANCSRNSTVGWTVGERPSTSTSHFTRSKRDGGGILDFEPQMDADGCRYERNGIPKDLCSSAFICGSK